MRNSTRAIGFGIAAVALFATTTISASANDTAVTFELTGGTLSVAPAASAALTGGGSGATAVSGALGDVVVTDNRGGVTGWAISAASSAFTNGTTTSTTVEYATGTVATTGVVTATGGTKALTATAVEVVAATAVEGNNTATWNPTLTVTLPSSSTAGAYSGTVTTSVL